LAWAVMAAMLVFIEIAIIYLSSLILSFWFFVG